MSDLVKILDGNTFVVSDRSGDIEASASDPTGLFSFGLLNVLHVHLPSALHARSPGGLRSRLSRDGIHE